MLNIEPNNFFFLDKILPVFYLLAILILTVFKFFAHRLNSPFPRQKNIDVITCDIINFLCLQLFCTCPQTSFLLAREGSKGGEFENARETDHKGNAAASVKETNFKSTCSKGGS